MEMQLTALADALGLELRGSDCRITGVATLEKAGPEEISFLANPKYTKLLETTEAGAVICHEHVAALPSRALISGNPYLDFARAVTLFARPQGSFSGVSELACIAPSAVLGDNCTVYPFVYVGPDASIGEGSALFPGCYVGEGCSVGRNCVLYPNVVLMARTVLGSNVIIHAGAVLGSDGFGFAPGPEGLHKIPQIGTVRVDDNVEIGANTCIDRAVLEATTVGGGTKIDNLVQIGHNVSLGKNCILVSQVGISGSTKVGDSVTMAGQVGVAGHLRIGDGATLGPKTGLGRDVAPGETLGGVPAMERGTFFRAMATIPKLPEMRRRLKKLEQELETIKQLMQQGRDDD